ncbi:hypothetical protein [Acidovorax sp.]|uniref:hypothetical protein n=1 Tax=Acidovorax sp. TaxID=1872122 RepID=UPI00262F906C|nr:hypothetical protein [Acidovorax sp.]
MVNAIVSSDTFKFLDIRSEKRRSAEDRRFTIDRSDLKFPQTDFEKALVALKRTGGSYAKEMSTAAGMQFLPIDQAFVDRVTAVTRLLGDRSLTPEQAASNIVALIPRAADIQAQLINPAAAVWDRYVACVIAQSVGSDKPDQQDGALAEAIRAAALLFLLREQGDADVHPSCFLMGSIRIGPDLVDVEQLRRDCKAEGRGKGDDTARLSQDSAVEEVVQLELALGELRNFLTTWSAAPPPAPAAPAPPVAADAVITKTFPGDLASIPNAVVSASTQALLTRDYGGTAGVNSIDGVDLPRTIARIDQRLRDAGEPLFALASSQDIASATQQMRLLGQELARSKSCSLDPAKVARLPLLLPTPILGPVLVGGTSAPSSIRALGVGDLKIVKQTLLRYDAGEVAHIENVLVGQSKERLHSVKQSTEETLFVSTERSASVEKDLQSTDRFELAEETQNTIKQERANETGVTITASYGPVSVSANTRFNDSSSQEQSSKVSRKFARETVNRSVEKVEQKVREERTRRTTLQVEETNRYTQEAKTKNIVGIYRWVDKVYRARVHVYGKRMMLEFMVPEPASVFLRSRTFRPDDPGAVTPPDALAFGPNDITRYNYTGLAARYGAEVEAPPPPLREMHMTLRSNTDTQPSKIEITEGWVAIRASGSAAWLAQPNGWLMLQVGHAQWEGGAPSWPPQSLGDVSGEIPVAVTTNRISAYNVMASVVAVPTPRLEEKWRLDTYKAIRTAYELRLSEYRDYLASQRQAELNLEVSQDAESRAIERRELQRSCIELLTQQHFDTLGAITNNPNSGWPEIDFAKAAAQGERVGYFQQSFEWEQMTYIFYPYFWGRQSEWKAMLASSGGDALFGRFLAAGFARVVVPVKPAHESDVAYFLATGRLWQGSEPPTIGDPRYVDILDEIKESLDAPDEGSPEGEPWQFKIPTSLVLLDESEKLPSWPEQPGGLGTFTPSTATCDGVPYNLAQWPDAQAVLVAIRKLGYAIPEAGDAIATLRKARGTIRAVQTRFNQLGAAEVVGRPLTIDGDPGPCTLRALSYFTALLHDGKWPGVG